MNQTELSILDILKEDARTPPSQIAIMLGATEGEIASVIARLEKQRIILKYSTLVNWEKVGIEEVEAVIQVRVTPQRDRGFDALAEQIYYFDEVQSVYLMSGSYDLQVSIKARTLKQLALFVAEKLSTLDGVLSTATCFVLKKYKKQGVIIDRADEDDRLKVTL